MSLFKIGDLVWFSIEDSFPWLIKENPKVNRDFNIGFVFDITRHNVWVELDVPGAATDVYPFQERELNPAILVRRL